MASRNDNSIEIELKDENLDDLMQHSLKSIGNIFNNCQFNRGNDDKSKLKLNAKRSAFSAALIQMAKFIENPPDEATREPYPLKWLRNQTLFNGGWLPIHWFLTADQPNILDIKVIIDIFYNIND